MSSLNTEEVLLLENMMYMEDNAPLSKPQEGQSVEAWLNSIDISKIDPAKEYGSYMTGQDYISMINEIKENHPNLMDMRVANTHVDNEPGGGGGYSAIFVNENTGDAVVAFRGTAGDEWKDNFTGGGRTDCPDGVSTAQQQNALDWYQDQYKELGLEKYEITVTGHSKGGNKAKYITIMDDTIDNCVSFDGQGFSDEFVAKYADRIAERQSYIENHNVDYDYVNFLLNDVGETTYYHGYEYGDGGFLENHCPNTFFTKDENGNLIMAENPNGQAVEIKELDRFLNSCMRSVDGDKKRELLDLIGTMVQGGFSGDTDKAAFFRELMSDPDNQEMVSYLLAYTIKYEQANPDFMNAVRGVMHEFGMGDFVGIVDTVDAVLNWEHFDKLYNVLSGLGNYVVNSNGILSGFLVDQLLDYLKGKGINLTKDDLKMIFGVLGIVNADLDQITVEPNSGEDIKVGSAAGGRPARFHVQTQPMKDAAEKLEQICGRMDSIIEEISDVHNALILYEILSLWRIKRLGIDLGKERQKCEKMKNALSAVAGLYEKYENKIIAIIPG